MVDAPTVLVVAKDQSLVDQLIRSLKAHGLSVFGATSLDEAVRCMKLLDPQVVVVDPASEECFALLDDFSSGWKSLGLVAIVESEVAAQRARELGIDEVIMSRDIGAVVDAVLDLLVEKPDWLAQGEGVRVLVVDDEPEIRDLLSDVLSRRGYTVTEAASGAEALQLFDHDPNIDLVLLDVILPEKGGIETLKELKRRDPELTVILMTAIADAEVARQAHRLGAFDYVLKPLDFDELEGRIIAGLATGEYHHQPWWKR